MGPPNASRSLGCIVRAVELEITATSPENCSYFGLGDTVFRVVENWQECLDVRQSQTKSIRLVLVVQIGQRIHTDRLGSHTSLNGRGLRQHIFHQIAALGAARECLPLQKGNFMGKAMLTMHHGVNPAGWNLLSRGVALAAHVGCNCSAQVTNRNYDDHCRKFEI